MKMPKASKLMRGAAAGLVAGIVASYAMEKFQAAVSSLTESEEKNGPEKKQSEPMTEKVAGEFSETVLDHEPTKDEKAVGGEAVHYAVGGVSGMLYGVAAEIAPKSTTGLGLPFGTSVWLGADEIGTWASGLAKAPTEYPASKHLYALSSHLVYGLTTELVRRGVRKIL
jgi:putative membrane protein